MRPIIARHEGTIVKSLGDGLLVTFPNSEQACTAAIEMQQHTQTDKLNLTGGAKIAITVAVHTGDVFLYKDDLFGDVINTTARVSSITNPSTILITNAVRRTFHDVFSRSAWSRYFSSHPRPRA
jgi:adenylate cyclase